MSINISAKTDYTSIITGSLASQKKSNTSDLASLTKTMMGGSGDSTLADYAAIKNGSYGKLLKAYYSEVEADKKAESSSDSKKTDSKDSDSKKTDSKEKTTESKTSKSDTSLSSIIDISI